MEEPKTASRSLSPAESEAFFATGFDALSAAPGSQPGLSSEPKDLQGSPGRSWRTQGDGGADDGLDSGLRCRDCENFRHAMPRHKIGCRYAFQNCPGCACAGETHIASCPIAAQLKLATDHCCEGVDMPVIGSVHSPDCRNMRPVLRASHTLSPDPYGAGWDQAVAARMDETRMIGGEPVRLPANASMGAEMIAPEQRNVTQLAGPGGLFGHLLFAARNLAQHRVIESSFCTAGFCLECKDETIPGGHVAHERGCRTGRVLDLVERICAIAPAFAADEPAAGDFKSQARASLALLDAAKGGAL